MESNIKTNHIWFDIYAVAAVTRILVYDIPILWSPNL